MAILATDDSYGADDYASERMVGEDPFMQAQIDGYEPTGKDRHLSNVLYMKYRKQAKQQGLK